jgi:hypothetical protein
LEIWWTVVPGVVMIGIIIYGLIIWNKIVAPAGPEAMSVELYAKQFDWTARYPGADGRLGATDFRLINATNPLGIVTEKTIETRLEELAKERDEITQKLHDEVLPESKIAEMEDRREHLERMSQRIIHLRLMMEEDIAAAGEASTYAHGSDDIVTKEFPPPRAQGGADRHPQPRRDPQHVPSPPARTDERGAGHVHPRSISRRPSPPTVCVRSRRTPPSTTYFCATRSAVPATTTCRWR